MMIKVLIISEYFPPKVMGGGEISSYLLAQNLARIKGIEVVVLTSAFPGLKKEEHGKNIRVYRYLKTGENPESFLSNIKRNIVFRRSLLREVEKLNKKENFDIIHCMNMTSISAIRLKSKIKAKFIIHVNSPLSVCPKGDLIYRNNTCSGNCDYKKFIDCIHKAGEIGKMKNRFYIKYNKPFLNIMYEKYKKLKEMTKQFDGYIAISSYLKESLSSDIKDKRSIRDKKNNINVVPNIVEVDDFSTIKNKNNIKNTKEPRILFLGIYNKAKGPEILIEALKGTKYKANFYGYGPLKEELVKKKQKYNLKNVEIYDKVPYSVVPELYQNHDIIVFPSVWPEPFGRIAIEAMASSRPIIASDIGGIKDTIKNNKTGILVEPNSAGELRKAIDMLMKNKELRESLGKEGRKVAIKKYNGKAIAKQVEGIYRTLIK
jgi:glycosyltransferase involved in cell wall biosynthesis